MQDNFKNLMIGVFVASACVIVIFILLFLHPGTGDEGQVLYVRFGDIDKVNVGTRVTFAGKPIGEVSQIQDVAQEPGHERTGPKDEYNHIFPYQLKLLIDTGVKVFDSDQFSLRTSGLLGERSVAIIPISPPVGYNPRLVTKDDIIYAHEAGSVEETMKEFKEVADKVELALDEAIAIMQDIRKQEIVLKISATVQNLNEITTALNQPEQLHAIINNIQDFSSELAQRLPPSWDTFDESLDSLNVTMTNAKEISATTKVIVDNVSKGQGTLGRLLVRDDMYLELKSLFSKFDTVANDVNHYGLLFQLDKGWQRLRARRMNLMTKLSSPQEFRNYFNDEMDQISTSLSRVSMVLDKVQFCCPECPLSDNREFTKVFAELLRRTDEMEESLKMYNTQVMENEVIKTELSPL